MRTKSKAKSRKVVKSGVLRESAKGYRIAAHKGHLCVFSYHEEGDDTTACIYGDPAGLRFLATLLNDVADIEQAKVSSCVGPLHYHIYKEDGHLHPLSHHLLVGRLTVKKDGSLEGLTPSGS